MPSGLRHRFWLESVSGSVTGIVAIITLLWHDWIEAVFGTHPDSGNGSAEWLVVLVLFLVTVALATYAELDALTADIPAGPTKPQPSEAARESHNRGLIR